MRLTPSQQEIFDHLLVSLPIGNVFVVWTNRGLGKTTMLEELHRERGGALLTMRHYMDAIKSRNPLQMEETFEQLLMDALQHNELVIMDDLDLLYNVICGCSPFAHYPRGNFLEAPLTAIVSYANEHGKKIVFGNEGRTPTAVSSRCYYSRLKKFTAEDYSFLCETYLEKKGKELDFTKIFRFAPKLNAHQLKSACYWFVNRPCDTDTFIEYLRSQRMASNVDLGEVEAVDLSTLKGLDDILESLEANLVMPLEQDRLATEFSIKPKRGVLLAGPPGTGKTTIGRALAHRLRSKFFLIDGTFISGTTGFYDRIQQVFEAAKTNAPSIIFIDDSDVIFENKEDFGLYRYLLTMLDGLEGESNKRVCVMMTTMDVASVPRALVRSGRIELWLETRLPDREARHQILNDLARSLPQEMQTVDLAVIADGTDDLTGADLRRLIDDAKILYAYDKSKNVPPRGLNSYFDRAVESIRSNKKKYADAEKKASSKISGFGDGFDFGAMMRDVEAAMPSFLKDARKSSD